MVNKLVIIFFINISIHCCIVRLDPELLVNGQFTTESLKDFLIIAYNEQKITDPAFARHNCLTVEDLAGQGGVLTGQLFLVKSMCGETVQEYIVKELIAGEQEISDLTLVANYKPLYPYITPNRVKDFPVIYLPIAYLCYNADGKDYYFSLIPKASGQEFLKIMNSYVAAQTEENKQRLQKAYATLGKTLANFHKLFMQPDQSSLKGTTLIHGDLHARNFFYDSETDTIYWIDNQCMGAATAQPQSILVDIQEALFKHFYEDDWLGFDKNIRNNPEPWIKDFYPIFFDSYLTAFGGDKNFHIQELKDILAQSENKWLQKLSISAIIFV